MVATNLETFHQSQKFRSLLLRYVESLTKATHSFSEGKKKIDIHISMPNGKIAVLHPLCRKVIAALERNGCQCDDWSKIFLMFSCENEKDHFKSQAVQAAVKSQIKDCSFVGNVILGLDLSIGGSSSRSESSTTSILKAGIHSNRQISNCIIEPGAKVYGNSVITDTFIGSSATVLNCGSVTYSHSGKTFCDIMTVSVGPEAGGGRPVKVAPESTVVSVCSSLMIGLNRSSTPENDEPIAISLNVVCGDLTHTNCASNIYVCSKSIIQSASSVQNAILLPQSSICNSVVDSVFLQWNSSIVNNSNVASSMLMECSEIGPNSVVASTILGPDSHLSCGEVHCSMIGPNTNSHHQSLLISALWPTGRGNVGYGSNIGSNHTGRIPDQECTVGEGVFWGLGCVIKFPVDLSRAAYSVIAAGVQLPPQSVAMPFSLIMAGGSVGQGRNEIVPGWLLKSSPYTIFRSEEKFRKRRKAKRHDYCGWKIIRPATVNACISARDALLSAKSSSEGVGEGSSSEKVFTEKDISQLGKNFMTNRGLNVGIDAYSNLIQRYALGGLFELFQSRVGIESIEKVYFEASSSNNQGMANAEGNHISWPILPWEEESFNNDAKLTQHKLHVLSVELPTLLGGDALKMPFAEMSVRCLKKLTELERLHAQTVLKSKQRDDNRGQQIIPDYANAHVKAEDDAVVLLAQNRAEEVISGCNEIIVSLFDSTSRL